MPWARGKDIAKNLSCQGFKFHKVLLHTEFEKCDRFYEDESSMSIVDKYEFKQIWPQNYIPYFHNASK